MSTFEVPDYCPESTDAFEKWLWGNGYTRETFVVKADQRDFEVVDVLDD